MDDWNDLKLVLAVHRDGSLRAAAAELGMDHSTIFRHLKAMEKKLGVRLFERMPGGAYHATAAGERMAASAERIEQETLSLGRDIAGRDRRPSGKLRVTSSETLAQSRLTPHLAAFCQVHPKIVVELVIDNRVLNLSRREADIALRPMRPTEGNLWGRKLADVAWTFYAARPPMVKTLEEIARLPLIGWGEEASGIKAADWLKRTMPATSVVYRTNSLVNQCLAARAGIGAALLPCYLGDGERGLERALADPVAALATELWMVTHRDLRNTARVRAFFDVVGRGMAAERNVFEGRPA
jgi:molybdate transport repressor ModE-like protein